MRNNKKKTEFSKKLFIFITALNVILLAFCCYMTWQTGDLQIMAVAIVGTAADQAVAIKYYYRKAEQENKLKLMSAFKIKPEKDDFDINNGGDF
jgi:hypothetical protein